MKTYLKTLGRMFKKHITRLLSILFIVLISVGFVSGLGLSTDKIDQSLTEYYIRTNASDFIVKSTAETARTSEEKDAVLSALRARYGEQNVNSGTSVDVDVEIDGETQLVRLYFFDDERTTVSVREVKESYAEEYDETAYDAQAGAEEKDKKLKGIPLGEEITLDFADILSQLAEQNDGTAPDFSAFPLPDGFFERKVIVTKTELSPLTFGNDGEPSYKNGDVEIPNTINGLNDLEYILDNILYLPSSLIPAIPFTNTKLLPTDDIYISMANRNLFNAFSGKYKSAVEAELAEISAIVGEDVRILTLYDNYSFSGLHNYADVVFKICMILMVVFMLVTILVVLSTMTRLLDEERAQVACLKTLGYPNRRIIFKYMLFAAIATGIGGVGAYFVGIGIARLIYVVFRYSFCMPVMTTRITILFFLIIFFAVVVLTLLATAIAGRKMTNETPANLLRPKVPKAGKKVFLERIPFLWKLLPFKYKSTTRNILRFKSRFLMTVIAVTFSTILVLAGLGLLDLCLFQGVNSPSVMAVSIVIVVFAGLLTGAVIYTLTNINISERNRELATLMVLGYFDGEVAGYIYREIYIDTVIGIIFGLPLSIPLLIYLFSIMTAGSLAGMSWFMWIIAPVLVLLFTAFVTLLLRRKIVKIDMNESLKAVE